MGYRAWVCLAVLGLAACGAQPTPDAGTGGGGGEATGGGSGGGGGGLNDTCQTAEVIPGAGTFTGSTKGATRDYAPDCTGFPNEGEDVVFAITVPAGNRVKLRAAWIDPTAAAFDPSLYIIDSPAESCDATLADGGSGIACLAASDESDGPDEELQWLNDAATARTVFLVVDSYRGRAQPGPDGGVGRGTSGDFILEVAFEQPAAGDACGSAVVLQDGVAQNQLPLNGFSNDYPGSSTCAGDLGPDRAFKLSVPAGAVATVNVTPSSGLDPMLSASTSAASCGVTCVANADSGANGAAETLSWKNNTGATVDLFIVVDAYGTTSGTFGIVGTISTPGADDVCEGATALTDGATLSHSTAGYANDYALHNASTGCATSGYAGPDRAYSFTVPSMQRARVTVTPADGGLNPSLNLLDSAYAACSATPRVCSTGTNVGGNGQAEALTVFNTGAGALDYFAIVDSASTSGVAYDISYALDTPAADDTCTTAVTGLVDDGGVVDGTLTGFVGDYGGVGLGCFQAGGADRVYRARLEAGQKLTATVTPTTDGGFDGVVNFIVGAPSACETLPRTCVGGFDFTVRNQAESGGYVNASAGPIDVFMVVADYEKDSTNTDFTVSSVIGPTPAGESCETPRVTSPQTFPGETLLGASADVTYAATATSCISTQGLPDVVYEVEVPAGKELVAIATPQTTVNLALNLVEGSCRGVTACLANANAGGAGIAETLRWTNSGSTAKTVKLVVVGVPPGTFALDLRIP